jgi:class 3 adenylate cyclase
VGDNADRIADAIEEFLTGSHAPVAADRVLATVLFTDIVGATDKAEALGDQRWRDLLANHHAAVRRSLDRFRGREVKTTGDGFLAVSTVQRAAFVALVRLQTKLASMGSKFELDFTPTNAR